MESILFTMPALCANERVCKWVRQRLLQTEIFFAKPGREHFCRRATPFALHVTNFRMPNQTPRTSPPSQAFLDVFCAHSSPGNCLPFDQFMALALYHPTVGYYRSGRQRVGRGQGTDFFTATTSGPLFGELIVAACHSLLGNASLADTAFVEIGAEPGGGVLTGVQHGFGAARTIRVGEPLQLSGKCVVFSNELFDAQPFRRFLFRAGSWREFGVQLANGSLREVEMEARPAPTDLPLAAPEGYRIDLPRAAVELAEKIAGQSWSGLFVAFDYGKSWRELSTAAPVGTARAYHRHTQSNELLAQPGEQDLTCHVCWDWLAEALLRHDFAQPQIESQEAFLIRRATEVLAATATAEAARFSQRKLALLQLLHHLGQKFQVLWALRNDA
jgi:SAM-dependent MidA family methyltransferase